jgi:prophage regulatory protein
MKMKKLKGDAKPEIVYLSDIAVGKRYGVCRATPWRWTEAGNFPIPIKLSPGCTRWLLSDIEKWEQERRNETQTGAKK